MREKLLRCIGSIGRESKNFKMLHRVWFAVIMLQLQFIICGFIHKKLLCCTNVCGVDVFRSSITS